jgi:hypothetical protein
VNIRPDFEPRPPLRSPIHREQLPSNGNGLTADPEKEILKNDKIFESQVPKQSIPTPSDKQVDYPKFGVQDVINWINGGKYRSDELYKSLSAALETLKKRQQVCFNDVQ